MTIRFRIWAKRHEARIASKYNPHVVVTADVGQVVVGRFRSGREVKP